MKIFMICSKAFYNKIPSIKKELEKSGHIITLPNCYDAPETEAKYRGTNKHADWKAGMIKHSEEVISEVDSVLVLNYTKNGIDNYYYPRSDGTTRIKIAELVSNSSSSIDFITKNSTLPTGEYKILVEVFGSADGIYYGIEASASTEVPMQIINDTYGLDVSLNEDRQAVIDSKTGQVIDSEGYVQDAKYIENTSKDADGNTVTTKTEDFDNKIKFLLDYQSGLSNPYITVSLYRRDYTEEYSQNYTLVDFQDYTSEDLVPTKREKEYVMAESNPMSITTNYYKMKPNLMTGTYKLVYKLYDGDTYVGEAFDYIVIK